ncbi:MAG: NfeD family protein [Paracoccaceae bacterium]|jgi:inner membrane protein|nr:NfeD family protein [Paracoccaceae bacterium]
MEQGFLHLPLSQWLFILGIFFLVVEIVFLGFATFVLFFVGLAMLVTGALMAMGVLAEGINIAVVAVSLLSIGAAIVLWKPLKNIQSPTEEENIEVGFVGHRLQLDADIAPDQPGSYTYSGIVWVLVSDSAIAKATLVKVVQADVGQLKVVPVETD